MRQRSPPDIGVYRAGAALNLLTSTGRGALPFRRYGSVSNRCQRLILHALVIAGLLANLLQLISSNLGSGLKLLLSGLHYDLNADLSYQEPQLDQGQRGSTALNPALAEAAKMYWAG